MADKSEWKTPSIYGRRREGRWTPIRANAQDTRANPNSWQTHLVRKRWDIGLLRALSPRIMMMMTCCIGHKYRYYVKHKYSNLIKIIYVFINLIYKISVLIFKL